MELQKAQLCKDLVRQKAVSDRMAQELERARERMQNLLKLDKEEGVKGIVVYVVLDSAMGP